MNPLIDRETLYASLDAFANYVTALEKRVQATREKAAAQGHIVRCARHCSACCRLRVDVSAPSALRIARVLLREKPSLLAKLKDRLLEDARLGEVVRDDKAWIALKRPCTFLTDDGSCSIYNDRPFVCRKVLVTSDPKLCDDIGLLDKAQATMIETTAELENYRNTFMAFAERCLLPLHGHLPLMVLWALRVLETMPTKEVTWTTPSSPPSPSGPFSDSAASPSCSPGR